MQGLENGKYNTEGYMHNKDTNVRVSHGRTNDVVRYILGDSQRILPNDDPPGKR